MKVDIIQTSFAAGEIGASLYGRTDIVQYANACAIVQNMLPRSYGPALSMPGTRYVATVSDSTLKTRVIPFVFNKTDSYIIEMGDLYMRFYTNRGQIVSQAGVEDLSAYGSDLKAQWKCNDNTNSTTVVDTQSSHNGSVSTLTSSLTTTAISSTGFNLDGRYHVSVADHADFTRTASSQPMTIAAWVYYTNNGATQTIASKTGEYDLLVNSNDQLSFNVYSSVSSGVKLLLHCDGVDGATAFTDSGDTVHTVTANGDGQIDTDQYKFGGASGFFSSTGYLSVPDSDDWDWGTSDFTVDCWVRINNVSTDGQMIWDNGGGGVDGIRLQWRNSGTYQVTIKNTDFNFTYAATSGTWHHVAVTRNGSNLRFFVNGNQIGTTQTDSSDLSSLTSGFNIAADINGVTRLSGHIDEFRVVKGVAVWTSNFTPSASAYQGTVHNSWEVNSSIASGWHLVALVFSGDGTNESDCKIYLDGSLVTSTFTTDPGYTRMMDGANLFRIGATSSAGANNWYSKIDNISFFHIALTSAQISALYTTSVYQIATVFKENEIFDIQFTQLNDVIWLAHASHPPQKLVRTSANEWAISDAPITGGPFLSTNSDTSTTLALSATQGTINITAATGKTVFTLSGSTLGHHNAFFAIGGLTTETSTTTGLKETAYVKITHVINSYTATATVIKNPPVTTATANWAEGAWSAVRGYPSKVILQERRLWFARTNHEPQKEWGSRIYQYENFAVDTAADDDAINIGLASNEANEIQWLAAGKSLIAGTYGGAFVTNSGSTDPITNDNVNASEEIGFGCQPIAPEKVGSFLYYVQRFGKKLREMFYNWELDTYKAVDKTILSPHILEDGVVDMAVQNNPETILYCVLTSGTLATMTRESDQEVTAWAKHTTSGTYTSIAMIPSQTKSYDEPWVIVSRWINGNKRQYVEYFEDMTVPDRQDKVLYLHSALSYDAYESTTTSAVTISLSATAGSVTVTSSSAYFNGAMVNRKMRAIDADGATLGEGTITATASTTSLTLSITTAFSALSYSSGYWGVSIRSVSGLDHLEAKTVGILADGMTDSLTRTIASGTVTLTTTAFVVSVGLPYDQIIYTLPKEAGSPRGTSQGKWQRLNRVSFKVNRSTQNFKYGPDANNLDDINLAITPTVTSLYTGVLPAQAGAIAMRGGYNRGAQIYIKNSQPLPLEILSIMGELETYDS